MAEDTIYQDDWTQRLKETPPDPLEYIRQVHESWLAELEGLAVEAIATNDWTTFYAHVVDFQKEHDLYDETLIAIGEDSLPECLTVRHFLAEASADELETPSAGPSQTTN